jgi:hypothetical protein
MVEIKWPKNIPFSSKIPFKHFLWRMCNRIIMGEVRYGRPNAEKMYLTRLKKELKAYIRTGNQEHLVNLSNYAYLESGWPEHPKSHYDNTVKSVTR